MQADKTASQPSLFKIIHMIVMGSLVCAALCACCLALHLGLYRQADENYSHALALFRLLKHRAGLPIPCHSCPLLPLPCCTLR